LKELDRVGDGYAHLDECGQLAREQDEVLRPDAEEGGELAIDPAPPALCRAHGYDPIPSIDEAAVHRCCGLTLRDTLFELASG
jgi:hypothetical protein